MGWLIAFSASLCFSIATPIARGALTAGVGANEMLVSRMALAALFMGLTIAVMDFKLLRTGWRCFWISFGAGMLNGTGMLLYTWGLQRLTSSMTAMLIALSPLYVLTLLALRGERFTYRHIVRLALSLIGVYLLIGPGGEVDPIGVVWILLSMVLFSLQITTLQWFLMEYDARPVTFYMLLAMVVCVLAMWGLEGAVWQPLGMHGWLASIALAFVSTYVSRLLVFAAIGRIGGGQMAMLSPVETLMSVMWSFLFLGERLSPVQWIGGIFILTSAALA
ncbi:DMT family transporter, partial [uncultured Arthrobacter sp.]|uniref:DMT family transporter n=1 Tax=uncultured Arthrobacter sp. TaxID=114050 RepID=UPI003216BEA4